MKSLEEAWEIAAISSASSPGQVVAYYSLSIGDHPFSGERPWEDRWRTLRGITDYQNKRILELGCNMGLLSTMLVKEEGAAAALGVDVDPSIIKAAGKLSKALGADIELECVDLDDPGDWEALLEAFEPDIVFALNVLNWVQQKDRLLAFLSRFQEVIFEGHDSPEEEIRRFESLGFEVEFVILTERNRAVLHCTKQ